MSEAAFQRIDLPASSERERAVQRVAEAAHRMNEAVSTGLSVELIRASRCHDGAGSWGDQIVPTIREAPDKTA